jgi:predicted RNase H-like nuclease (RuvC/YqgF family)
MPIELLYIIPIVALAFFVLILLFFAQRKSQRLPVLQGAPLSTDAVAAQSKRSTEARLAEFENTITVINKALTDQQAVIEKFQRENSSYNQEIEKLQSKLREVHQEYDIVVSENYSLRAKVKTLMKKAEPGHAAFTEENAPRDADAFSSLHAASARERSEMNMNLYEDTRLFKASTLDDTKEIDISDLQ